MNRGALNKIRSASKFIPRLNHRKSNCRRKCLHVTLRTELRLRRWAVPNPAKWGPRYNDLIKSYGKILTQ
jgi:hypothetical protein